MAIFDFRSLNSDVLGLAFGFALAAMQKLWRGYQERCADTWPISYGRIDRISIDTEHNKVKFKCYYTYRVGEETFIGSFHKTFEDPEEAQTWQDALQKKQVSVRYKPQSPAHSQLRESDLELIVRSAAPVLQVPTSNQSSGVKVFAARICAVLCALGLAINLAILLEQYVVKPLVAPELGSLAGWAALPVFFLGVWIGGRGKLAGRTPEWMKYLGYALFYYAVFSAFVGSTHLSGNQHARGLDVRYQLFLYFSALESCYVRLHQNDEKQPEYGLLSGFPLK